MFKRNAKFISLVALLLCTALILGLSPWQVSAQKAAPISFVDDDGRQIELDKPCQRIICLYSAHLENLYSIGAGELIIGRQKSCSYPPEVRELPIFDAEADPESMVAVNPDLVLLRPTTSRKNPQLVQALEAVGITVVSLYPESFASFAPYLEKLGLLTGKEAEVKEILSKFAEDIAELEALGAKVPETERKKVFFESTEKNVRTVTKDSFPALALQIVGAINVASDAEAIRPGTSIATFGEEKLLALADEIEVYVSQLGAMNPSITAASIAERPGFETVKAIKDGKIFIANEKTISSPTLRFVTGARELGRYLYPEIFDDLSTVDSAAPANKAQLAELLTKWLHLPIFTIESGKYYQEKREGHYYGLYADVPAGTQYFDFVETVVNAGYLTGEKVGEKEIFAPDTPVSKELLAQALFLTKEFKPSSKPQKIADIGACKQATIVQIMVDNGIFSLDEKGEFKPETELSLGEILTYLQKLN